MLSVEGEAVPLKTLVNTAQAKGAVERWLLEVGWATCTQAPQIHAWFGVVGIGLAGSGLRSFADIQCAEL